MVARYFYEQLIYYGFLKSTTQNAKKNSPVKGLRVKNATLISKRGGAQMSLTLLRGSVEGGGGGGGTCPWCPDSCVAMHPNHWHWSAFFRC